MEPINSDLYGAAYLHDATPYDISPTLEDPKCVAIPLGHNPGDRMHGLAFNLGRGGHPGHALTFGATRSGKGVNAIIPALLTYMGSVVVIDPKGENAWITGKYRSSFSRVVVLDPWNEVNERYGAQVGETVQITKFNPLSVLDPTARDFNDDVVALADALTVTDDNINSHFIDSARQLIAGLIAAAVEANPGKASLRDVRDLITAEDEKLVDAIKSIREANPNSLGARKLRRFIPKVRYDKKGQPKPLAVTSEISSIRSTAETQTAVLDSQNLLDAMETDAPPFDLTELATGRVSLFLVLPVDKLETHGRWLRLILTQTLRTISRQRKPPAYPVLFVVDEMGTIGNLSSLEQSFGLMAGLGIRVWGFLQDLSQLKRDYPKSWETFWSNSSIIQVLACGDLTTSEHVSRYLGTGTVNAKTGGYTYKQKQYGPGDSFNRRVTLRLAQNIEIKDPQKAWEAASQVVNASGNFRNNEDGSKTFASGLKIGKPTWSVFEQIKQELRAAGTNDAGYTEWSPDEQLASRPVLFPDEVRNSDPGSSIILMPGKGNFRLERFTYYSDPVFSPRARHDPNTPAPVIKHPAAPPPIVEHVPVQPSQPVVNQAGPMSPQPLDLGELGAKAGKLVGGLMDRLNKR